MQVMILSIPPQRTHPRLPPYSRSDQLLLLPGRAARYSSKDGQLFIGLMADRGAMVFAPAKAGPSDYFL